MSVSIKTGIAPAPVEETVQSPTDIAVDKIVAETSCTPQEAASCLGWISGFVEAARCTNYSWQYPTTGQMAGRDYEIFDKIMEHGAVAAPGSAHEAVQAAVLDPSRDELTLTHDDRDEFGSPRYCTVQVAIGVFGTS